MPAYTSQQSSSKGWDTSVEITTHHHASKGATLSFRDLHYSVPMKKEGIDKVILKGVNGIANAGEVFAILGSSGAGKTTLLDVLASRKSFGKVDGDVTINGHKAHHSQVKYISAYVQQEDLMLSTLTARETLSYAAQLRMPNHSREAIDKEIDGLLKDLALSHVAESQIGNEMTRGLSGGEKKRLSIALQLLSNPAILFLDEPTTGLDAFNSFGVMKRVQAIAKDQGRTVICSVHQPRFTIFELFDKVMLMSRGEVAYFGPSSEAISVFSSLGHHCPEHENPADYLIDVIVRAEGSTDQSVRQAIVDASKERALSIPAPELGPNLQKGEGGTGAARSSLARQFTVLTKRSFVALMRSPTATKAQIGQTIFMALLIGTIYLGLKLDQPSIQNRMGM